MQEKNKKNAEISARIEQVIKIEGVNANTFADKLGYRRSQTIYDIMNAKSAPSFDFFYKFENSEYSEKYNISWLLTGKEPMLKNINTDVSITSIDLGLTNKSVIRQGTPYYDLPVSAGNMGVLCNWEEHKPAGYINIESFNECDAAFPIVGISMEPLIYKGDIIGVQEIDISIKKWDCLQTGVIYLIITRDDRMIKYLEDASGGEYIICSSPNFHTFKVHKSEVLELYRVKAIARAL